MMRSFIDQGLNRYPSIEKICDGSTLLEGAHIRDFSEGGQYDIPENMVLLCPNHHTEYDSDLIDFAPDGMIHHYYRDNEYDGAMVQYDISYLYRGYIVHYNRRSFLRKRFGDNASEEGQ